MFEDITNETVLTRDQKTLLYVIQTLNELVKKGVMEGGEFEITQAGIDHIKDFTPTNDEIRKAITSLRLLGHIK